MNDEKKKTFPRAVYRKGSGKDVGNGKFEAESRVVKNQDELTQLGGDWVESPQAAATGGAKGSALNEGGAQTRPNDPNATISADTLTGADARTGTHHEADKHKMKGK